MTADAIIFLDRDGVLNGLVVDERSGLPESPYRAQDVELLPHAVAGLRVLDELGLPLVVVSNQPAAAKGTTTRAALAAVHDELDRQLREAGVRVTSYRYCLHYEGGADPALGVACDCRKPNPGMLLAEAAERGLTDLSRSWMIGDSDVDVLAGRAAGCHTVLIEEPSSAHRRASGAEGDARCADLLEAANLVAAAHASQGLLA